MALWTPGDTLVLATHNLGKLREIEELLYPFAVPVVAAGALGLPEPEETGLTFIANAELKARAAASGSGKPALADDSGLAVSGLGGNPGIYSARWAGANKDFGMAIDRVRAELGDTPDRDAAFHCALSLAWPTGEIVTFEGIVRGTLTFPARGGKGFGYDPIFIPEGHSQTFGEMDPIAKHAMSHRARAFEPLVKAVFA
jgi:XTP/dITP diphosphohydrolase